MISRMKMGLIRIKEYIILVFFDWNPLKYSVSKSHLNFVGKYENKNSVNLIGDIILFKDVKETMIMK